MDPIRLILSFKMSDEGRTQVRGAARVALTADGRLDLYGQDRKITDSLKLDRLHSFVIQPLPPDAAWTA
jgi:hypothetical protein